MLQRNATIHLPSPIRTISRTLGGLVLLGTLASGGVLFFSKPDLAHAERTQTEGAPATRTPIAAPVGSQSNPALAAPSNGIRKIPLIGGVDPTPPASPKSFQEPVGASSAPALFTPAPPAPQPAPSTLAVATPAAAGPSSAAAPTECLPANFQVVLRDLDAKFGPMTLVSTTELHTDNHSPGSVRHKLHSACRAVDFKLKGELKTVTAYLRSRSEVAGVTAFANNGVIHIDYNEPRKVAQR